MQMFSTIARQQFDSLFCLGEQFLASNNLNAALLCFDYGFSSGIPSFSSLDLSQMTPVLSNLFEYVRILHNILFNVPENLDIWKVFGVKENIDDATFTVTSGTFAYQHRGKVILDPTTDLKNDSNQISIPKDLLLGIIRGGLHERLCKLVAEENDACRHAPAFSICMHFITFGNCTQDPCPRSHVTPDHDWFQLWIRAHLLQILIYHSIVPLQRPQLVYPQQRCAICRFNILITDACPGFGLKSCLMLFILPTTLWDPFQISFQTTKWFRGLPSQLAGYVPYASHWNFSHSTRFSHLC